MWPLPAETGGTSVSTGDSGLGLVSEASHPLSSQIHNGSGLGVERLTDLLVFGFLQHSPSDKLQEELKGLGRTLPVPTGPQGPCEEELQTDGSRCSHFVSEGRNRGGCPPLLPRITSDSQGT